MRSVPGVCEGDEALMAYFANGTEGELYRERFCERCTNWRDLDDGRGPGCPIMDVHFMYAYELCNESEHPGKIMLDMLIPMVDHTFSDGLTYPVPGECSMFHAKDRGAEIEG
jgi:hypothetical protein